MGLKDTSHHMKTLLSSILRDLEKANRGNKAASQRVRTCSVRLEKVAKAYRKESVAAERKMEKKLDAAIKEEKMAAKKEERMAAKKKAAAKKRR